MANQTVDNSQFNSIRIPKTKELYPTNYRLHLEPDLKEFTYSGRVDISLQCKDPTINDLVLNYHDIKVLRGKFTTNSKEERALTDVVYGPSHDMMRLKFGSSSFLDGGIVSLWFTGHLNDKMKGFYRTSWTSNEGEKVIACTTQFESTDARRCFPCFDEPAIKATFDVSLSFPVYPKVSGVDYIALSNTSVKQEIFDEKEQKKTVSFDTTPIMSTYLLAFVIGPFEYISAADRKNRPIRVYTTPGKKAQGQYALEVAVKSLMFYEDYFNIDYPLTKMDLIAIPDFTNGAMENWGLVTYRETCLLVDPKNTSTVTKQNVALVVAHELAHQWFGNLVTMEWWTHLWLNEGFASFMEYLCINHIFPEYDIWSQFVTDAFMPALVLDALHNSHPIEVQVDHPSEIEEIFDQISYSKGASIIRMIYDYVGDHAFRKGLENYLNELAYKNALTEDLWDHLGKSANKPVRHIMRCWTDQKGFPWLEVTTKQSGDDIILTVVQDKFTSDGKPSNTDSRRWNIPVSIATGLDFKSVQKSLIEEQSSTIILKNIGQELFKLNPNVVGFYRVSYTDEVLTRFSKAIESKTLGPLDRLEIQNDLFALCEAGNADTSKLLSFLLSFGNEDNYTVMSAIDSSIGRLSGLLAHTDVLEPFQKFVSKIYMNQYSDLGWVPDEGESHTRMMLRTLIINRLVSVGYLPVCQKAIEFYKEAQCSGKPLLADMRGPIYKAVAEHGTDLQFESLFQIYRDSDLQEEKNRAARAFGSSSSETRAKKALDFAMSDEVRNQDRFIIIASVSMKNPDLSFKLLQDKKDYFRTTYESGTIMQRIVQYCTKNFGTVEKLEEVKSFFENNKFPGTERVLQQSLETIQINIDWLRRDLAGVSSWLSSFESGSQ